MRADLTGFVRPGGPGPLSALGAFLASRWGRRRGGEAAIMRAQRRGLRRLLADPLLARAVDGRPPRSLDELPVVDKAADLARFASVNRFGVRLETARAVAADPALVDRGGLPADVTAGLSSGTSGRPGVFLVSPSERMRWAGTVLGRLLDPASLRQLLSPWRPPLRVAFVLRAGSDLYESVGGRRVDFRFVDLMAPFERVLDEVARARPDILVAPSSVLAALAAEAGRGRLRVSPRLVLAVAEVLEPQTAGAVRAVWGTTPRRVYQATEGLLAMDCPHGRLHLEERHVVVEREWLDAERRRFVPVVTDLERRAQLVLRRRLDDVLRLPERAERCPCGDAGAVVEAVEGRADEAIELEAAGDDDRLDADGPDAGPAERGSTVTAFPDQVRRAMAAAGVGDWRMRWSPGRLEVSLRDDAPAERARAAAAIAELCATLGAKPVSPGFAPWREPAPGAKAVRIRRDETSG